MVAHQEIPFLCFYGIFRCKDGQGWLFRIIGPLSHASFYLVEISFRSFFGKMFPSDIRGILNSLLGIFTAFGTAGYVKVT